MRIRLEPSAITLAPGRPAQVTVEVTNTLEVIDGIAVDVEVTPGFTASSDPPLVPLFPDGTAEVSLQVAVSATCPAGEHELAVTARSTVRSGEQETVFLRVTILPVPAARLTVLPPVRSGRHKGTFAVLCENSGNTLLDLSLAASDAERAVLTRFDRPELTIGPGNSNSAQLTVLTRRHLLGSDFGHQITVVATAPELDVDTQARFRQRPVIPRGARTVLTLGAIIALWAVIFVVAINHVLAKDPLTKDAPASFYAAANTAGTSSASALGPAGAVQLAQSAAGGPTPAGAVPKSGVVLGVGGTVSGTVDAASTQAAIGRITVEAVRDTPRGPALVASAATDDTGSYSLAGLLPGAYKLLFTAHGYRDVWYPTASSESTAQPITVDSMATVTGIDAVISGLRATITGTVQTGQSPQLPVSVVVLGSQGPTKPIARVTTNAQGAYSVPDLPAPGTYDLSFSAAGYTVASDVEDVAGGEQHVANTVTLTAANGSIEGTVTDGKSPLGGVTITATSNGQTYTSATPTAGAVGQFTIPNLPSPATYVLTFAKPGYGTHTVAEDLGPGQAVTGLAVALAGGAGEVSGIVRSPSGVPLGGATVTVSGGAPPLTTQTLTAGSVGSFVVSGLATPGSYTLTFSLAGYTSQTIGVNLSSSGSAKNVDVVLPLYSAALTGTVTAKGGGPLAGVTVTETDGVTVQTTVTSSSPAGGFSLVGLAPGAYSVTFTLANYGNQTALVVLTPGETADVKIVLDPVS